MKTKEATAQEEQTGQEFNRKCQSRLSGSSGTNVIIETTKTPERQKQAKDPFGLPKPFSLP